MAKCKVTGESYSFLWLTHCTLLTPVPTPTIPISSEFSLLFKKIDVSLLLIGSLYIRFNSIRLLWIYIYIYIYIRKCKIQRLCVVLEPVLDRHPTV